MFTAESLLEAYRRPSANSTKTAVRIHSFLSGLWVWLSEIFGHGAILSKPEQALFDRRDSGSLIIIPTIFASGRRALLGKRRHHGSITTGQPSLRSVFGMIELHLHLAAVLETGNRGHYQSALSSSTAPWLLRDDRFGMELQWELRGQNEVPGTWCLLVNEAERAQPPSKQRSFRAPRVGVTSSSRRICNLTG